MENWPVGAWNLRQPGSGRTSAYFAHYWDSGYRIIDIEKSSPGIVWRLAPTGSQYLASRSLLWPLHRYLNCAIMVRNPAGAGGVCRNSVTDIGRPFDCWTQETRSGPGVRGLATIAYNSGSAPLLFRAILNDHHHHDSVSPTLGDRLLSAPSGVTLKLNCAQQVEQRKTDARGRSSHARLTSALLDNMLQTI
jgi:hypothetical protein